MELPFPYFPIEAEQEPFNKVIDLNDLSDIEQDNANEIVYNISDSIDSINTKSIKRKFKEFKCPEVNCCKIFKDKTSLKKHIIVHGEKLFICNICQKKFLDNSKLRRHSLVHSGEKPYECPVCSKRFSLDFNLKTHMRIHSGEKPYACIYPGCFKRFSQSSNLSAHEKIHEIVKDNKTLEDLNSKPIFNENPLRYLIDNIYSGTETINNIHKINELFEIMKKGKEEQFAFYNSNNNNNNNHSGDIPGMHVQKRLYIKKMHFNNDKQNKSMTLNNSSENNESEKFKRQIFAVIRNSEEMPKFENENNLIINNEFEEIDLHHIINEINNDSQINNYNI